MNIPDNYDLWESHDREQQKQLAKLPVCDYCGEPIQDEEFYLIEGENICPSCIDKHFKVRSEDFI